VTATHRVFALSVARRLTTRLNMPVHVALSAVDVFSYEQFVRSLPTTATMVVLDVPPLSRPCVLEMDPAITFPILDRLAGGSGGPQKTARPLDDKEKAVMRGVVEGMLESLKEAWRDAVEIKPTVVRIESDRAVECGLSPSELVVFSAFETSIGHAQGMTNLCIPVAPLQGIAAKLQAVEPRSYTGSPVAIRRGPR
jgi:flagellar motor switch protein FliM